MYSIKGVAGGSSSPSSQGSRRSVAFGLLLLFLLFVLLLLSLLCFVEVSRFKLSDLRAISRPVGGRSRLGLTLSSRRRLNLMFPCWLRLFSAKLRGLILPTLGRKLDDVVVKLLVVDRGDGGVATSNGLEGMLLVSLKRNESKRRTSNNRVSDWQHAVEDDDAKTRRVADRRTCGEGLCF